MTNDYDKYPHPTNNIALRKDTLYYISCRNSYEELLVDMTSH